MNKYQKDKIKDAKNKDEEFEISKIEEGELWII
jgi:hypothetical protein